MTAGTLASNLASVAPPLTPKRILAARIIAIAADFLQIVAFPFFFEGVASPFANALDFVMAVTMILLLGWHWAFLPTVLAEVVPFFDLVPTWTAAVFIVTRGQTPAPPELPPAGPPTPAAPTPALPPEKNGP